MFNQKIRKNQILQKSLLLVLVLSFLFPPVKSNAQPKQQVTQQYNVLFIFIDDMNNRLNYLGYPEVLTPNLQRLMNRGMSFTNAYCQFPVCNASRTSLLSGWRPDKTNVQGNNQDPALRVPPGSNYLQEYMHKFGYRTERYGKIYHSQFEYEFSWDYSEGRGDDEGMRGIEKISDNFPAGSWGIYPNQDTTIEDYTISRNLANRLKQTSTQPLFLALGLTAHNPFVPPIDFWNLYGSANPSINLPFWQSSQTITGNNANNIALPSTPVNDRDDIPAIAIDPENSLVKPDSEWQKTIQAYYGEVSLMDRNIGLVLNQMDSLNLWENTIVVFTSDHGQQLGEHNGVWRKNTLFEESLKVPLIVCAPGLPSGTSNKLVELVDIYPTITELCKVPTPNNLEGSSFVRLLQNPDQTWKKAAFSQVRTKPPYTLINKAEAVHSENFHYNYWGPYGEELYDRAADPNEYINLVTDPDYATVLGNMRLIRQQGWNNALPPACDSIKYYRDNDGDGYGNSDSLFKGCYQPIGYVVLKNDCNDINPAINPGAAEVCDGIDNNCNEKTDENTVLAIISPAKEVTICSGKTTTLTANNIPGASYQWMRNGTVASGFTNKTLKTNLPGNYQVIVKVNNLCADTSDVTVVIVNPSPSAVITALDNLDICDLGSVRLRASNGTDVTYQWRKNGVNISGATNRFYTATTTGTYQVIVAGSNGCLTTSKNTVVTSSCFAAATGAVSYDDLSIATAGLSFTVFPNPAKDNVSLRLYCGKPGNVHIKIITVTGQQLFIKKENIVKGFNTFKIVLPRISTGMYYVEITGDAGTQRAKLTIE